MTIASIQLSLLASIDIPRDFKIQNMCYVRKVKKFLSGLVQMRSSFRRVRGTQNLLDLNKEII